MTKRRIFDELMEGIGAMQAQREGKITLRRYKIKAMRHKLMANNPPDA